MSLYAYRMRIDNSSGMQDIHRMIIIVKMDSTIRLAIEYHPEERYFSRNAY